MAIVNTCERDPTPYEGASGIQQRSGVDEMWILVTCIFSASFKGKNRKNFNRKKKQKTGFSQINVFFFNTRPYSITLFVHCV